MSGLQSIVNDSTLVVYNSWADSQQDDSYLGIFTATEDGVFIPSLSSNEDSQIDSILLPYSPNVTMTFAQNQLDIHYEKLKKQFLENNRETINTDSSNN